LRAGTDGVAPKRSTRRGSLNRWPESHRR
jgi:hypothetical protein